MVWTVSALLVSGPYYNGSAPESTQKLGISLVSKHQLPLSLKEVNHTEVLGSRQRGEEDFPTGGSPAGM